MKQIFKYSFCLVLSFLMTMTLTAQELPIDIANISDQQLIQIINKYQLNGLSDIEFETIAKQKGLSNEQIVILKRRMTEVDPLNNKNNSNNKSKTVDDNIADRNKIEIQAPTIKKEPIFIAPILKVFGSATS